MMSILSRMPAAVGPGRAALRWAVDLAVRALAAFTLANLVLGLISPRLDCTWLWINLSGVPYPVAWTVLAAFVVGAFCYSRFGERGRTAVRVLVAAIGLWCLRDAVDYYRLVALGRIATGLPLPLSLTVAIALGVWASDPPVRRGRRPAAGLATGGALAALWLFVQISTFGATDYRRDADAIIVFGAAVTPSGRPSLALYDRTRTGCLLYRQGLAGKVVFSGGRNPAVPLSEPQAMRAAALRMGVPDRDILLDEAGVNTEATIAHAARLARDHTWQRLLMVSHDYHLSRIKLLSHRAGLTVYTVPAEESRRLRRKPYYVLRELGAWVYHYVRTGVVVSAAGREPSPDEERKSLSNNLLGSPPWAIAGCAGQRGPVQTARAAGAGRAPTDFSSCVPATE